MAKKKKGTPKRDSKRFKVLTPPGNMFSYFSSAAPSITKKEFCEELNQQSNERIRKECVSKTNEQTSGNCKGRSAGTPALVDLIVVIDTSGSMSDEATNLSNIANAAIQAAAQSCPSDLRVAWFGIEGTWPNTLFNKSYRDYLFANNAGLSNADLSGTPNDFEDGAAAVHDLAKLYDWRPNTTRIIFYLGDESLEGGDPQDASDVTATTQAIDTANIEVVSVFTYLGTGTPNAATENDYARLANDTNGQAFKAPIANFGGFQTVLEQIICAGGRTEVCKKLEEPKIVPCLKLRWGDGPEDRIETDDWEILCISACNPYSNVTLKDFTVHLIIADASGQPVAALPDGTPSVLIKPGFQIHFGDLQPCNSDEEDPNSCVTREAVLISRGARDEVYTIFVIYCFEACFTYVDAHAAFRLNLVKS